MKSLSRHAVYWMPAREHPLWSAGCTWLGRDPEDAAHSMPTREATAAPRRYGFHATLKAPMHLRDGVEDDEWNAAVRSIASTSQPFPMPPLEIAMMAHFIALRPVGAIDARHPLQRLADRCVLELDDLRAPFDDREWQERSSGLDAADLILSRRLGYHYVLNRWRFHMTLSDPFAGDAASAAIEASMLDEARHHFADALRPSLMASEIGVFVEAAAGEPFLLTHRFKLGG